MSTNGIQTPVIIGCDHAAYPLKEKIKSYLSEKSIDFEDVGTDSESSVDYSEFGIKVASQVSTGQIQSGDSALRYRSGNVNGGKQISPCSSCPLQ